VGTSSPPDEDFRFYASLYREGHNASSLGYKFLCFFKIVEGLIDRRRKRTRELKENGADVESSHDTLPTSEADCVKWLNLQFPHVGEWLNEDLEQIFPAECRGVNVENVLKDQLRPMRNRIAHALLDDGSPGFFPDCTKDLVDAHRWLWLTMAISKSLLQGEFPANFPIRSRPMQ
jgi:hypothetical protein